MAESKMEPPPQIGNPDEECCGGRHAPTNGGKPLGLSCQLCEHASCYWRNEPAAAARLATQSSV